MFAATPPAIERKINPLAIQKNSIIGICFNLKQ